jgi:hypothetical protein
VFHTLAVKVRARHGIAGTTGLSSFGYQAPRNYTGKDSFVLTATMSERGQTGQANIYFDVTITD